MLRRAGFLLVLSLFACALPCVAQTLLTDITVPGTPLGVAVNPGTNRIYVGITTQPGYALSVIDGKSNTVVDTLPLTYGALVDAVNVATGMVYVAGCTYNESQVSCGVTVVNGSTDAVVTTIPINAANGLGIEGIAVNPVTNRIYVSDATNLVIDVIDGSSNKITSSVSLGGEQPLGIAADFGTNQIMVAINGNQMDIINGWNNTVAKKITVGSENANVAVNSFTNRAYVTNENFGPSTLGVVNISNSKVIAQLPVGDTPFDVATDIFTDLIFVSNIGDGTVVVINGKTNAKVGSVAAPSNFLDVNPVTELLYAGDISGNFVHVITE